MGKLWKIESGAPAVSFAQPQAMLQARHERVQHMLDLLARLRVHLRSHGADD